MFSSCCIVYFLRVISKMQQESDICNSCFRNGILVTHVFVYLHVFSCIFFLVLSVAL